MPEDKIALYLNTGTTAQLDACVTLIYSLLPGINGYPVIPVQNPNSLIDHFIALHEMLCSNAPPPLSQLPVCNMLVV